MEKESKPQELRAAEFRANVRFTEGEYVRITREQAESGHSIPWLLKTAYFSKSLAPPTLDPESRKTAIRELNHIGNNINQIAKQANAGIIRGIERDLAEALRLLQMLYSFLSRDYGDPLPASPSPREER